MDLHWNPPPEGVVKVNVHSTTFINPMPNGNTSGIGVILRNSDGNFVRSISGTIRNVTPLASQLWAIFTEMRRAYLERAGTVIIETYNIEAFAAIKYYNDGIPEEVRDLIQQNLTRKNDPNWRCKIRYVYPRRNRVAIYLAQVGGEILSRLYLFNEPFGRVEELMDLDMGLGPHAQEVIEVQMMYEEYVQMEMLMGDGWGGPFEVGLAGGVIMNIGISGAAMHGNELEIQDVMYKDGLEGEDDFDDYF